MLIISRTGVIYNKLVELLNLNLQNATKRLEEDSNIKKKEWYKYGNNDVLKQLETKIKNEIVGCSVSKSDLLDLISKSKID